MPTKLLAGAAAVDITPTESCFLWGYPHVARYSTGVHDPLLASALYLSDGQTAVLFVGTDVLLVSKALASAHGNELPRRRVCRQPTSWLPPRRAIPAPSRWNISAATRWFPTPIRVSFNGWRTAIVAAAEAACSAARPAQLGLAVADGSAVGGNRRNPRGPSNPRTPALVVCASDDSAAIAAMFICNMHPTVLHEDSTLISGDFPAMTRQYLQGTILGGCPVLCQNGPCGNQSPRHVARGNTFDEAKRLGKLLGASIATAIGTICYEDKLLLECRQSFVQLPLREFPTVAEAEARVQQAEDRLAGLRCSQVEPGTVRTAECDWFGAEETLLLARAAHDGRLQTVASSACPPRFK